MPSPQQTLGQLGEHIAREHLERQGYHLYARHWTCRYGELDLIMWDRGELVFVEVKMRTYSTYAYPEEMVSWGKNKKLLKTALRFLEDERLDDVFWRFDTVAILGSPEHYQISHFTDTIREERMG